MRISNQNAYWLEVAGLSLASVVLFRFGVLLLLFLVPLQILWVRRGERAGLIGSGLFLGVQLVLKGIDYLRIRDLLAIGEASPGLLFIDIVLPVGFLAGLFALNTVQAIMPSGQSGERRMLSGGERVSAALAVAVAIYVPVMLVLDNAGAVDEVISIQLAVIQSVLTDSAATATEVAELTDLVVRVISSGFLAVHLLVLLVNWWFGTRMAFRGRVSPSGEIAERLAGFQLSDYQLSSRLIWLLIASWGGVLLSIVVELSWFAYLLWNLALVSLVLYGIQGIAILWYFMQRRKMTRGARMGIAVALIVALLVPGVNLVVLVGLPGLGASEVWVNYHRFERSGDEQ